MKDLRVSVNGDIKLYRDLSDDFSDFLYEDGRILGLGETVQQSDFLFEAVPILDELRFWVQADDSGLVYLVSIERNRPGHSIVGAARMPHTEAKDVYVA